MDLSANNQTILQRAESAVLSRDYEQAARLYKGLLMADPENINLLFCLGGLYTKSGKDESALPFYKDIVRLQPNNVNALNNLGAIYRRMKRYDESIATLEHAVIADENDPQIFYNMGFTYKLMEKYDDAIQCFNTVVEKNPNDVLAYNHIGSIYAALGKYNDAVAAYQRGFKADPNHPILHLNLAMTYEKMNDFSKAQAEYESALRKKPGWTEAIDGYTNLLIKNNQTKAAGAIVKKGLFLNPKDAGMHAKMGDVYRKQNSYQNAETEYNCALNIQPEHKHAMSGLAETLEDTGRSEEALEVLDRLEHLHPQDSEVQKQKTHVLLSAGKYDEANQMIQEMISSDENDAVALNLLGQYYICTGDEAKASGCFKKIRAVAPKYTDFYKDGGKRFKQKGNLEKSEIYYSKYVESNPNDTDGLKRLAETYEAQGKLDKAVASYRQIGTFDDSNEESKKGVERVNQKIFNEAAKASSDFDEFNDADEDIFQNSSGKKGHQKVVEEISDEVVPLYDSNGNEEPDYGTLDDSAQSSLDPDMTSISNEADKKEPGPELPKYQQNSQYEKLMTEDITAEDIFADGRLDEQIEADSQEKYAESLDDLIPEDEEEDSKFSAASLLEDTTSAEEFFNQAPSAKKPMQKKEEFEPEFEEDQDFRDNSSDDYETSLEDGWEDDEEFEKKPKTRNRPEPKYEEEPEFEEEKEQEPEPVQKKEESAPAAEPEFEDEPEFEETAPVAEEPIDETFAEEEKESLSDSEMDMTPEFDELQEETVVSDETNGSMEEKMSADVLKEAAENLQRAAARFMEDDDKPATMDSGLYEKAAETLQSVVDAISELNMADKLKHTVKLFEELRSLSEFLPEEKRNDFNESKTKLQLEYIISKLSGKLGLLKTAQDLRDSLQCESSFVVDESGTELLVKVLSMAKDLSVHLPDSGVSKNLNRQIDSLLEKIG